MNLSVNIEDFRHRAASIAPEHYARERLLAFYSAAIALADEPALTAAVASARNHGLNRSSLNEVVLQSYLFLGFPRMLVAAEHLHNRYKEEREGLPLTPVSGEEAAEWFERGEALCRRVYDGNYDRLKERVEEVAPEIFRWMIFEGYGKVLSRPGIDVIERELAIIACLMIEDRPAQLFSHIRGALNVGAQPSQVRQVIEDIGAAAGSGYTTSKDICLRLRLP